MALFHSLGANVLSTWIGIASLAAIMWGIERIFSRDAISLESQLRSLRYWAFAGLGTGIAVTLYGRIADALQPRPLVVIPLRSWLATPPLHWTMVVLGPLLAVILYDFFDYWMHRAQHRWFWRLHSIHHSIEELSGINSYFHWTEQFFRIAFISLPAAYLVGIDGVATVFIAELLVRVQGYYLHSPARLHVGPVLRRVIADNRFHRIHHSVHAEHFDMNFGAGTTIWDQLFGTAYFPARGEWPETGVADQPETASLRDYLWGPFERWLPAVSPSTGVPAFAKSQPVQFAAIGSLAFYLHSLFWWTEPRDMGLFLEPWFQHIVHYGAVGAFSHPFSNYTPSYLYLLSMASLVHGLVEPMFAIKLLSVLGNLFAIWAVSDLIRVCGGRRRYAILLLAVPSFVINAALLAQCDALWAGACVLAVSGMIGNRPIKALLWCGIAVSFKAQAAFIAPFIIGALFGHRRPLWQWLIPPAVFIATMFPAWLAGWPAWELLMVYPGQAAWGDFPSRLANPWMFGTVYAAERAHQLYWLGFAAAGAASIGIGVFASNRIREPRTMLLLAMLSALALPFFLPKMLERYFFLAGLISIALAVSYTSRATVFIALAVETASLLSLLTYMYFYVDPYLTLIGALFAASALIATMALIEYRGAPTIAVQRSSGPLIQWQGMGRT